MVTKDLFDRKRRQKLQEAIRKGDLHLLDKEPPAEPVHGPSYSAASFADMMILEAAAGGDVAAVSEALAKGADVNARRRVSRMDDGRLLDCETPLMLASRHGHVNIVRYLLANGADVNAEYDSGSGTLNALSIARRNLHLDKDYGQIADILVRAGAVDRYS